MSQQHPPTPEHPVQRSGRLSATAWCVRCDNPSAMTLEGTNTWLLSRGPQRRVVVIDPGPLDPVHQDAVAEQVAATGGQVELILLTHHHDDHTGGADRLAEMTGATVRGAGRGEPFEDNELVTVDALDLHVLLTPGHTADSICLVDIAEQVLYSGDTILGRGTTVVAHPDGDLASYLASLERLRRLATAGAVSTLAPGHGPVNGDVEAVIGYYRQHREDRLGQVRAALTGLRGPAPADGTELPTELPTEQPTEQGAEQEADDLAWRIVEQVYAEVPQEVWPAAWRSVRAQVDYLDREQR